MFILARYGKIQYLPVLRGEGVGYIFTNVNVNIELFLLCALFYTGRGAVIAE